MSNRIFSISNGAGQFLDVYEDCVVIRKEGARQILGGAGNGQSRVTYKDISGFHIHYPEKSFFLSRNTGYVLINAAGSAISSDVNALIKNPNAFVFARTDLIPEVKKAEEYINQAIQKARNSFGGISAADELMKFKALLDSGVITQSEFDVKKEQLLKK